METAIKTKLADLPMEFIVELPLGADDAIIESMLSSLRSQILYNSRFEEDPIEEDRVHVRVVSRELDRIKLKVEL